MFLKVHTRMSKVVRLLNDRDSSISHATTGIAVLCSAQSDDLLGAQQS